MPRRYVYAQESLTSNTVTGTTANQVQAILSFTPSRNSVNVAVFWQAVMSGSDVNSDFRAGLRQSSNSNHILQSVNIEPRDATNYEWVGGVAILQNVANSSPTTLQVYYGEESTGATVTCRDAKIIVVELGTNDKWSVAYAPQTYGAEQSDGYAAYSSSCTLVPANSNVAIIGSGTFSRSSKSDDTRLSTRIFVGNDTTQNAHGFLYGDRSRDTTTYEPYWHIVNVRNSGNTYSMRHDVGFSAFINIRERTLLALDMDDWNTAVFNSNENFSTRTTSTSPVQALLNSFTLTDPDSVLTLSSWFGNHSSTTTSARFQFEIDSVDQFAVPITIEPENGDTDFLTATTWCLGAIDYAPMAAGAHSGRIQYYSESGASSTGARGMNITQLGANGSIDFYARTGGTWKKGIPNQRLSGTWKAAEDVYVKVGGVWKEVARDGDGVSGTYYTGFSDIYDPVFPDAPSQGPGPSPSPAGGSSCLSVDTLITMWDETKKFVQELEIGDIVRTLTGVQGTVTGIEPVTLSPYRRMIRLHHKDGRVLRISDDHDIWTRIDGTETWGTYNYNWWLYEDELYTDLKEIRGTPLIPMRYHEHATDYGWTNVRPEYDVNHNPNEIIYNVYLNQGGGFIADGFVVIAPGTAEYDQDSVRWNGL